jgi:hypothetical protein
MVISALVAFLYGSMMYGIFPVLPEVSWEAHLFGAISGLMVAYNYRKEGPQRKTFDWENEEEDDNDEFYKEETPESETTIDENGNMKIVYHYKDKNNNGPA